MHSRRPAAYPCKYSSFAGLGGGVLPTEGTDQMIHVLFEKLVDHAEGVLVWRRVKIEGAAEEVVGGIGDEELFGRCSVAADVEEYPPYPIFGDEGRVVDGAGLIGMFKGELVGVVAQPVEFVWAYLLIADIDTCSEAGEVDVYPPGIGCYAIEIGAVLHDVGIDGVFEGIGIAGFVEGLVFVRREVDLEIAPPFGGIDRVAGIDKCQERKEKDETRYRHDVDFDV